MRGFSSWEAVVFLLLSAVLLGTLAGFSIQEFQTAKGLFGSIWADRLLETIEFRELPAGSVHETVLAVPKGFHNQTLFASGRSWKIVVRFGDRAVSKELPLKPVFDPANLLEIPGRHRVVVWKEQDSVLIKKV